MIAQENNIALNNFIYDELILSPLTDIVTNLENKEYSDCDVDWLNKELNKYVGFALEVLSKKINLGTAIGGIMNDYNRNRFLKYFKTLLRFFENHK